MAIVTRADLEASLAELARGVQDPHAGILGPHSIAWQVGGDLGVFLGGGRAALLQLAHPFVAYAVEQHSQTRADVVGRFQRTFRNVFAMVFGELDDAMFAARRVHQIHTRIHGTIPIDVGAWRAGTPYHANDADALRWVHATLVDTTIVVREKLDGVLPTARKDAYMVEMNRFAALFGIPRALLPNSWADHAAYMTSMIPRLAVAPVAREIAAFLLGRSGMVQPPLGRLVEALTASLEATGRRAARVARAAVSPAARARRRDPGALGGGASPRGSTAEPARRVDRAPAVRPLAPGHRNIDTARRPKQCSFAERSGRLLPARGARERFSTMRANARRNAITRLRAGSRVPPRTAYVPAYG
jgi:uncharacterized protein (DUF2236 family)